MDTPEEDGPETYEVFEVLFDAGEENPVTEELVPYGEVVPEPEYEPAMGNKVFAGWYADGQDVPYDFSTPVTSGLTLVARWNDETFENLTVNFYDGDDLYKQSSVAYEGAVERPADPVWDGVEFRGWYEDVPLDSALTDEEVAAIQEDSELNDLLWVVDNETLRLRFDFKDAIVEDTDLHARWEDAVYKVSFWDGGKLVDTDETQGRVDTTLSLGERLQYAFDGWFTDAALTKRFDSESSITGNTSLYASWVPVSYTVNFDSASDEVAAPESQVVPAGNTATEPAVPVWPGHTFLGWYEDLHEKVGADELAAIKANDPELYARLWVRDDTVLIAHDFAHDSILYDLQLVARWADEEAPTSDDPTPTPTPDDKPTADPASGDNSGDNSAPASASSTTPAASTSPQALAPRVAANKLPNTGDEPSVIAATTVGGTLIVLLGFTLRRRSHAR